VSVGAREFNWILGPVPRIERSLASDGVASDVNREAHDLFLSRKHLLYCGNAAFIRRSALLFPLFYLFRLHGTIVHLMRCGHLDAIMIVAVTTGDYARGLQETR